MNPEPRPALKKAQPYEEMFDVVEGTGNVVAQWGVDRDRVTLPSLEDLDAVVDAAQAELDHLSEIHHWHRRFGDLRIDEVALYFSSRSVLDMAVSQMVRMEGMTHFNGAEDAVRTAPLDTHYAVDYEFFKHMDRQYRIEAMAITGGLSPLHEAWDHAPRPRMVHVSFKVPTLAVYSEVLHDLDTSLSTDRYFMGQACLSTYGRFSYWQRASDIMDGTGTTPWFKPRVNLRDGS